MTKATIPYTYRITHLPSKKWYYGVRYAIGCSPDDLFVTYFTSSKIIKGLIKEDGVKSFSVEIRKTFNDVNSARMWENKVLRKILNWDVCLNLAAFPAISDESLQKSHITKSTIQNNGLTIYQNSAIKWKNKKYLIDPVSGLTYEELRIQKSKNTYLKNIHKHKPRLGLIGERNPTKRLEVRRKISNSLKLAYKTGKIKNAFLGKKHSGDSLQKMAEKKIGENNPCYGTYFINDGVVNKRIKYDFPIPDGWVKGRLITDKHKSNAAINNAFKLQFMSCVITRKTYNKGNACKMFPDLKKYF